MNENPSIPSFKSVKVPVPGEDFDLSSVWLDQYSDGKSKTSLKFLQWSRSGVKYALPGQLEEYQKAYEADLIKHQLNFKEALKAVNWDLLVVAPSSRPFASHFAHAAREIGNQPIVIFEKVAKASATTGCSVSELEASLTFNSSLDLSCFSAVLIVDDVLADGNTAAAIIVRLRKSGLNENAQIMLAVALRVLPSPSKSKFNLRSLQLL